MRLSSDIILAASSGINACYEHELNLRGYKVPAIENLGVTKDQYDSIDLSDNQIVKLENFPRMPHLRTLLLNNNLIKRVGDNLGQQLPNLETLVLSNNKIGSLAELEGLANIKSLKMLSLLSNPVTRKQHYRSYLIYKLPSLTVLDFTRVKHAERVNAEKFFKSAEGLALEAAIKKAREMQPGQAIAQAEAASKHRLTAVQAAKLKQMIDNASTPEEIDRLEGLLRTGNLPPELLAEE